MLSLPRACVKFLISGLRSYIPQALWHNPPPHKKICYVPPETAFLGGRLPQLLFQGKSPGLRRGLENAWARL